MILSIQFHDMTRQLVEHVIGALRRVCFAAEEENAGARRVAGAALALQSAQLAAAAGKFAASVASVGQSLEDIARLIGEMVAESQTLSGAHEGGDTYFLQMEYGCSAILVNIRVLAEADCATRITGGDLDGNIGRMRESIREIRAIENQMRHMAFNTMIVATHVGGSGDAINLLALSIGGTGG
jgi:hypothetical protein